MSETCLALYFMFVCTACPGWCGRACVFLPLLFLLRAWVLAWKTNLWRNPPFFFLWSPNFEKYRILSKVGVYFHRQHSMCTFIDPVLCTVPYPVRTDGISIFYLCVQYTSVIVHGDCIAISSLLLCTTSAV